MARAAGTMNAAAAMLLLVTVATAVDAATDSQVTATAPAAAAVGGRRGGGRAQPAGQTECVAVCGETVTSCLLDCYTVPSAGAARLGERKILPICLLDCTNAAMFCASDCSAQNLLN